jgi:hypothetical protein
MLFGVLALATVVAVSGTSAKSIMFKAVSATWLGCSSMDGRINDSLLWQEPPLRALPLPPVI